MITAIKRMISPAFRLAEDFSALDLPVMQPCQRYACVDDVRSCFAHDPRQIQKQAFSINGNHAAIAADITAGLESLITEQHNEENIELRSITGCVPSRSSSNDRTLCAWGQTLLATSNTFAHLSSPHAQVAFGMREALQGREPYFSRASWMPGLLYCENPGSSEVLAETIALADAHGIPLTLRGHVTTYSANLDVARTLCINYGAWVLDQNAADRVKRILNQHRIDYCWSFIGRQTPLIGHQVVLYLPPAQELAEEARRHLGDLLGRNRCMTVYSWLEHFRLL